MITTNDLKNGIVIGVGDDIFEVIEFLHVKPGKGPAFVRTKLKNLRTLAVIERTFRAGEKVEKIRLEEREMEFLYRDGDNFVFMDSSTYEQVQVPQHTLGDAVDLLKENARISIVFNDTEIIGVNLPNFVELEITYAEPGAKGDTVGLVTKPATLETGAVIQVPLFVEAGEKIKIDTRTHSYVERVKQ
ncbi:MAG: elongation factor P [bacterium]